jgi:hypothetical protein
MCDRIYHNHLDGCTIKNIRNAGVIWKLGYITGYEENNTIVCYGVSYELK